MNLREAVYKFPLFKSLIDDLQLAYNVSRDMLYASCFLSDKKLLEDEYYNVSEMLKLIKKDSSIASTLHVKLCKLRDIRGSLANLSNYRTLDDIELFEIKSFSINIEELRKLCKTHRIKVVDIPDLSPVIKTLDPDNTSIPMFYVYDSYSSELAAIRKKIKKANTDEDKELAENLRFEAEKLEDEVRFKLSETLREHSANIQKAVFAIANLEILLAKAVQAFDLNLCCPTIDDNKIEYKQLFNPVIAASLQKMSKKFQPIDIILYKSPCLITGANMSGKTVILKTIALAQYLSQFGFFVPATSAKICLVDEILTSVTDDQDELKGLSSFAAEVLNVNNIIKAVKSKKIILALVDELAGTTNPIEGTAIVNALLKILDLHSTCSIVTTHYSDVDYPVRRLRVKGLREITDGVKITRSNIGDFIDYSLIEVDKSDVPHEALRIMEILGCDEEFLSYAKEAEKDKV